MKYINNRNQFLEKSKNKIDKYKSLELIDEEANSGPFANDIPWNDSLIGRLINSTIRKAKIGRDLVRIKLVILRLEAAFDELLCQSAVSKLSDEHKKDFNKVIIYSFLDNLNEAIKNGYKVKLIKNLTDSTITEIKTIEDFDNKDALIKKLEDFRKFLDQFDDGDGADDPTITDVKEESNKEPKEEQKESPKEEPKDENINENFYKNTILLLKSVLDIYEIVSKKSITTNKSDDSNLDDSNLDEISKEPNTDIVDKNEKLFYNNEMLPISESEMVLENPKAINAWQKIINQFNVVEFTKKIEKIQELIKKSEEGDSVYKNWTMYIGKQLIANEQTIGKNKISFDKLISEDTNTSSYSDIPKAISLISNILLAFENNNLVNELSDASKLIKDYILYYNKLKNLYPNLKKKVAETKETKLLKYDSFLSTLNESDDSNTTNIDDQTDKITDKDNTDDASDKPTDDKVQDKPTDKQVEEVSDPKVITPFQKILDYWEKNIDVKSYTIQRTEADKIKTNLDRIDEKSDGITISGIDPIIEIVRIFNRAYKLHTFHVIPTGRTGGKVSNKTFNEYTSFGGGTPDSAGNSGGPYRNDRIFDQWENAVLKIMRNKTYQKIFRGDTVIKTDDDKVIKEAGKNLAKFMRDMLDGDDLYKGKASGQGAQCKFLEKYFGYSAAKNGDVAFGGEKEETEINTLANEIKSIDLLFTTKPIKMKSYADLEGTFFAIKGTDEKNKARQRYFYIQEVDSDYAYVTYCSSLYFYKTYINKTGISPSINKGDLPNGVNMESNNANNEKFEIKGTRIKLNSLIDNDGNWKLNGVNRIQNINNYETNKNIPTNPTKLGKEETINIESVYTLGSISKENDVEVIERFKLSKDITNEMSNVGGIINIKNSNDINKTYFTK